MEKDDELKGSGDSYDYGARIYDPRLGRWMSIDRLTKMYPNISPFAFVGNSPIIFVDVDGRLLRDANGNIIYTKGKVQTVSEKGYTITVIHVTIYSNDGTGHPGQIITIKDAKGEDVTKDLKQATYDCHGLVKADGKILIPSSKNSGGDNIEGILKGDNNGILEESNSIEEAKKGDILIFRNDKKRIIHTALVNDDEADTYTSKTGYYEENPNTTLATLKKFYGDNVSFIPKQEDKTLESLSKEGENGTAAYSKKEVKKAIKSAKKNQKNNN